MIYILHGDNLSAIRTYILKLQQELNAESKSELTLDQSADDVYSATASADFFGNNPFVTLDISDLGRKNADAYIEVLTKVPADTTLIIFSNKELGKANAFLKAAPELKARTLVFNDVPKSNVFKFVDAVFSKNRKLAYLELSNLEEDGEDAFYIFSMLMYGLRNLVYLKFDSAMQHKISPFMKSKFVRFSQGFEGGEIKSLYQDLYDMEVKAKTGRINLALMIPLSVEKILN